MLKFFLLEFLEASASPAVFFFFFSDCVTKDNVKAVLKSAVTLTCPLTQKPTQVIWEVVHGETIKKIASVSNCSSTCSIEANNNMGQRPSCKVRAVQDVEKGTESLIISPVENTDAVWYRCTVQNGTGSYCSELKINVQGLFLSKFIILICENKHGCEYNLLALSYVALFLISF